MRRCRALALVFELVTMAGACGTPAHRSPVALASAAPAADAVPEEASPRPDA